jgi:ribonuclease P protein component
MKRGRRSASRNFVVFVHAEIATESEPARVNRLGITVSKKVGNSVIRNRVKRRVRAWFRQTRDALPAGVELVVIARRPARNLAGERLFTELNQVVARGATF